MFWPSIFFNLLTIHFPPAHFCFKLFSVELHAVNHKQKRCIYNVAGTFFGIEFYDGYDFTKAACNHYSKKVTFHFLFYKKVWILKTWHQSI